MSARKVELVLRKRSWPSKGPRKLVELCWPKGVSDGRKSGERDVLSARKVDGGQRVVMLNMLTGVEELRGAFSRRDGSRRR